MRRVTLSDTLSREKRLFVPITSPKVGIFVCGLTPYADAHIGHARGPVFFDVVARALTRWGYRVFSVQNVTNLDDKVIARAAEAGTDPLVLAERHFADWHRSLHALGVDSVNYFPHATDYMPEIVDQVRQLIDRGLAYASRGSVYFEVAKAPGYGRLSGQRVEALQPGARVEPDPGKRAPEDFVLWKAARPGEPSWESPWGPGRPGWHIEDTAITVRLLGPRYDLHGGGVDLKFPHHEAEIAQAEGATGESPLVNFWLHWGLLNYRGEKMAKSLGNVVALDAVLEKVGAGVLRFYYLNANYRNALDFEEGKSLEEARESYDRLRQPYVRIREQLARGGPERPGRELTAEQSAAAAQVVEDMDAVLADDFNTREAIARLFIWGRTVSSSWGDGLGSLSGDSLGQLAAPFDWAHEVLGLFDDGADTASRSSIGSIVEVALSARRRARARGDYAESDRIRDELRAAGLSVEDHGDTTRWNLRADGER